MDIDLMALLLPSFIVCTGLSVYFILYKKVDTKKSYVKIAITILINILIGGIYWYLKLASVEQLLVNFTISVTLHEWVIKFILSKFNITVNNDKGINI